MRGKKDCREKKRAEKRLIRSVFCLVFVSGMVMLFTCMIGKGLSGKDGRTDIGEASDAQESSTDLRGTVEEKERNCRLRQAGGFDNPIDDLYLPVIFGSNGEDKTALLESYEMTWRRQLEEYLKDYRSRCRRAKDREMVEAYSAAIQMAVDAQKDFMEYMGVEEEKRLWYSAQIYRCAFIKDIRGEFAPEGMEQGVMYAGWKQIQMQGLEDLDYEACGEFDNDIDRMYVTSMYEGCEAEIRGRQDAFDLDWCNALGETTMEFYETLDEEGKRLAGIWQESRENWKSMADGRFWWLPEELNGEPEDAILWGNGSRAALMEKDGWINRLYYLQLQSMMEKDGEAVQEEHAGEEHQGGMLWISGRKVLFEALTEGKNSAPLSVYSLEWEEGKDCGRILQRCSRILGEETEDTWKHYTWCLREAACRPSRVLRGWLILYQTKEGEAGFFYVKNRILYHVRADEEVNPSRVNVLKGRIEHLADEEWEEAENESWWENMLWHALEGRLPDDGFDWEDANVRQAVYTQAGSYSGSVPAREEMISLSYLHISKAEQVKTFGDLKKLSGLTSLTLTGSERGAIHYDITGDMVPELEELVFENVALEEADFLEKLPGVRTLGMIYCNLTDLSFLENYPHLTEVSFYENEIRDISPLAYCKELEIISLAYNKVTDISVLAELPELRQAGLFGNQITDIKPLQSLDKLEGVNLNSNQITDLSPLEGMTGLVVLGVADNRISDITPLRGMTRMYNLSLDANQIRNIDALSHMKEMEYLGLSQNLIEDYTPVKDMENLYFLSVGDNPGQDIGELVFTPWLLMGGGYETEELEKMQVYLDRFYPEKALLAEDLAKGDINGDGIEDIAITGLADVRGESKLWDSERYVYPFINRGDGTFTPLTPLETLGPGAGGIYGDPYEGILITENMLVVQVYGGSNWRWGSTRIYQYDAGSMKEKWEIDISHFVYNQGMDFTVHDKENNSWKQYAIAGEAEDHREILLIAQDNGETDPGWEELNALLSQFEEKHQISLPEIAADDAAPILDGWYDYHTYDYPVTREPAWILKKAAEEYLEEALPLPEVCYTSEEIRKSYEKLIGVEPPEEFYIGLMGGEGALMYYCHCTQEEDGFVHEIVVSRPDEAGECWGWKISLFYNESTDTFREGKRR